MVLLCIEGALGTAKWEDVLAFHSPRHNNDLHSLILEDLGGENWGLGDFVTTLQKLNMNFETKDQAHIGKV